VRALAMSEVFPLFEEEYGMNTGIGQSQRGKDTGRTCPDNYDVVFHGFLPGCFK
jgi:hypothetical protein